MTPTEKLLASDWAAGLASIQTLHDPAIWATAVRLAPGAAERGHAAERALRACRAIKDPLKRVAALGQVARAFLTVGERREALDVFEELDLSLELVTEVSEVATACDDLLAWAIDLDAAVGRRYAVRLAKLIEDESYWRLQHIMTHVIDHLARKQPGDLDDIVAAIPSGKVRAWATGRAARAKVRPK